MDTEELSVLETESRADRDAQAEVVLRGKKKNHGSELNSEAETHGQSTCMNRQIVQTRPNWVFMCRGFEFLSTE